MVRPAVPDDYPAIRKIVEAAFGRPLEAEIVDGVRAEGTGLADLVVEADGEIVGHILLSRMTVTPARFIAALGPVAVRPDAQGRGFGETLCRAGIEAVRQLGAEAVVLLGHPTYYPRFGFSTDAARQIASPYAGNAAFMALALTPGALAAPLKADFPPAFG